MNSSPIISARGLTKHFGEESAVTDLGFDMRAGSLLGLIGPSGCGKTTTVRLLTGVYRPSAGQVRVLGQDPLHFTAAARRRLGYMPQHFVLYPNLSVWENLNFTASLYGLGPRRGDRLTQMLEFVELNGHRRKLARSLSGGMQRRLALAATLVHNPEVIFLDEPTAGIDPVLRRKFWDYLAVLKAEGRTIVVTTQYVGEAAYCDYIGVMAAGRLLMVETLDGLRRRAQGGEVLELRAEQPLESQALAELRRMPWVVGPVRMVGERAAHVTVHDAGIAVPDLMAWTRDHGLTVASIEKHETHLDDVFVELVAREQADA